MVGWPLFNAYNRLYEYRLNFIIHTDLIAIYRKFWTENYNKLQITKQQKQIKITKWKPAILSQSQQSMELWLPQHTTVLHPPIPSLKTFWNWTGVTKSPSRWSRWTRAPKTTRSHGSRWTTTLVTTSCLKPTNSIYSTRWILMLT